MIKTQKMIETRNFLRLAYIKIRKPRFLTMHIKSNITWAYSVAAYLLDMTKIDIALTSESASDNITKIGRIGSQRSESASGRTFKF